MSRSSKKNKRIKNRLNILRELHLDKKRVKTVKKSLTTITLEPYRDQGLKVYKVNDREDRNSNQWEAKISIDRALQPSNKDTWEAIKERSNLKTEV